MVEGIRTCGRQGPAAQVGLVIAAAGAFPDLNVHGLGFRVYGLGFKV